MIRIKLANILLIKHTQTRFRPRARLLRRLKQKHHRAFRLHRLHRQSQRTQRSRMPIVPAFMRHPRALRTIRRVNLVLNRQRIKIRPKRNRRRIAFAAIQRIKIMPTVKQFQARVLTQKIHQPLLRPHLLPRQFRVRVQFMAQLDCQRHNPLQSLFQQHHPAPYDYLTKLTKHCSPPFFQLQCNIPNNRRQRTKHK